MTNENRVSAGFFKLLGTPFLAGRDFEERDTLSSPFVAIVNEAFAERILKTKDPIGRTFKQQASPGEPNPVFQIVGEVRNTKYSDVREPAGPIAYFPEAQETSPDPVLRTSRHSASANDTEFI